MPLLRLGQDNARRRRQGTAVLALGLSLLTTAGCASRSSGAGGDAGAAASEDAADVARARALVAQDAGLPERAEALALAESIEARAVREGAGARATELHLVAARLLARVWRIEGRDQD